MTVSQLGSLLYDGWVGLWLSVRILSTWGCNEFINFVCTKAPDSVVIGILINDPFDK